MKRLRNLELPSAFDVNRIALGVATLVVLGGVLGAAFAVGALSLFTDRYTVTAVFADSGGLKQGAAVRVAGIDVGKVVGVTADYSSGQVLIAFEINSSVALGPKTRAEVGTTTFLGGDFLKLIETQGTPNLRELPRDQRRIPLERTKTAFTLLSDLSALTKTAQDLDPKAINDVFDEIGGTITGNLDNIPTIVTNLEKLGSALSAHGEDFEQLVANAVQVSATLDDRDRQLTQLIDQSFALLDALNSRRDELASVLGSGSDAVNRVAAVFDEKRAQFESILGSVHTAVGAIDRHIPELNAGLAYAGELVNELANAIGTTADGTGYFNVMATGGSGVSLANLECIFDVVLLESNPCNGAFG